MIREATADEVNEIANDPSVYDMLVMGALHPQCALDYSEQVEHPFVTSLMIDGFAALFVWTSPGTYECHIMARKEVRGVTMMRASREMLTHMKEKGARRVWGQPSAYNPAAISFVKLMGLRYQGTGHHPIVGDVVYYEMEL